MPSTVDGVLVQWGDRLFYPATASTGVAHAGADGAALFGSAPRLCGSASARRSCAARRR